MQPNPNLTVEFTGRDIPAIGLWCGHPGRALDETAANFGVIVAFVNGPTLSMSRGDLSFLILEEYLRRGDRLVAGLHPIEDSRGPGLNAPGHEWPEGSRPE